MTPDLTGWAVVAIRPMTETEYRVAGWTPLGWGPWPDVMDLRSPDGTQEVTLFPMCDPEGNGPGHLAGGIVRWSKEMTA
jgi:hypothetical protein